MKIIQLQNDYLTKSVQLQKYKSYCINYQNSEFISYIWVIMIMMFVC